MTTKIKKADTVLVTKGKDKGKTGQVEKIFPKQNKGIVTQVNIMKKHLKPSKKNPSGGVSAFAAPLSLNNLAVICSNCKKPVRVKYQLTKSGKSRICQACQEVI